MGPDSSLEAAWKPRQARLPDAAPRRQRAVVFQGLDTSAEAFPALPGLLAAAGSMLAAGRRGPRAKT